MINPNFKIAVIPDHESGARDSKGPPSWWSCVYFISVLKLGDEFIGINFTIMSPIFYIQYIKYIYF